MILSASFFRMIEFPVRMNVAVHTAVSPNVNNFL